MKPDVATFIFNEHIITTSSFVVSTRKGKEHPTYKHETFFPQMTPVYKYIYIYMYMYVSTYYPQVSSDDIDWSSLWNPKLYIENVIGEPKVTASVALEHSLNGEACVVERWRCKSTYLENLELLEFPFDVQVQFCNKCLMFHERLLSISAKIRLLNIQRKY